MKRTMKCLALLLALLLGLSACGADQTPSTEPQGDTAGAPFEAKLDTEKAVELQAAVFFGNFEALDQVINSFNDIYPNVSITYDQVGSSGLPEFLSDNPQIDIFMTSTQKGYPQESCVDLLAEGVDVSAVADGLLESNTVDGKLCSLPMGLIFRGMVVNKTLLENEGLSVPETWGEFLDVLAALKEKGYTPIQGADYAVGDLAYNMVMTMLQNDPKLLEAVNSGDAAGAAALQTAYERLAELKDQGYFSETVNAAYPEDNYDEAILRFFEGDVPFWACDTEKVSGMKKRESKSEHFSAEPFDYEFILPPFGENGAYEYAEPWYGFAVNEGSDARDYAVEFLRFLAQQDQLNTLASVKGVPSITKQSDDARYTSLASLKTEDTAICDGSLSSFVGTYLQSSASELARGETATPADALTNFVSHCAETTQGMQEQP